VQLKNNAFFSLLVGRRKQKAARMRNLVSLGLVIDPLHSGTPERLDVFGYFISSCISLRACSQRVPDFVRPS